MGIFFSSCLSAVKEYCKATFPYEATNQDELDLKEGDIIHVLSKVRNRQRKCLLNHRQL